MMKNQNGDRRRKCFLRKRQSRCISLQDFTRAIVVVLGQRNNQTVIVFQARDTGNAAP